MSRTARGWLVGYAALLVVVYFAVPPERSRPDRLALVSLLVFVLWRLRRAVGTTGRPRPEWAPQEPPLGPPDELDVRLARLEAAARHSGDSKGAFERSLRSLLARLAEERLYRHHGIDAAADPRRARDVMGEELWQMLSAPADREAPGAGPQAAELDRLVAKVEAI